MAGRPWFPASSRVHLAREVAQNDAWEWRTPRKKVKELDTPDGSSQQNNQLCWSLRSDPLFELFTTNSCHRLGVGFVSNCRTVKQSRGSNVLKCKNLLMPKTFGRKLEHFLRAKKRKHAVKSTNRQVWNSESEWSIKMCWQFAVWCKAPNTYAKTSSDNQVTHQK